MNQKNTYASEQSLHSRHTTQEEGVKVNGLEQVIEMLRFADPVFRESLIKRLGQRDPNLALQLRKMFR